MGSAPHAPWHQAGAAVVALVRGGAPDLPAGITALPGPTVVMGVRYDASPVGPYVELSVAHPALVGLRPGLCVTSMAVNSALARTGLRANWGLPAEVGAVRWVDEPDGGAGRVAVEWPEAGIVVRGVRRGRGWWGLPLTLPWRGVQRRTDGPVVVPRRLTGLIRRARTEIDLDAAEGPFEWLAGEHRGFILSGLRFVVRPARHPAGLLKSLRAPLVAPEPALTDGRTRPGRVTLLPGA